MSGPHCKFGLSQIQIQETISNINNCSSEVRICLLEVNVFTKDFCYPQLGIYILQLDQSNVDLDHQHDMDHGPTWHGSPQSMWSHEHTWTHNTWASLGCRLNSFMCKRCINLTHTTSLNHVRVTNNMNHSNSLLIAICNIYIWARDCSLNIKSFNNCFTLILVKIRRLYGFSSFLNKILEGCTE